MELYELYYFFLYFQRGWYKNPKSMFRIIERFEKLLPKMLPLASAHKEFSTDVKEGEIMRDNIEFTEHYFSSFVAAKTVLRSAEKYSQLSHEKIPVDKIPLARYGLIKELNWD